MHSKEQSLALSLKANGLFGTLYYVFSYLLLKLRLRNYVYYKNNKVYLRVNSSDFPVFREIFLDMEYDLDYASTVDYIIDAGANIGASTLYFADRFPGAQILALEPDKENFSFLCKNTENFKNVVPINKGLWSETGFLNLSSRVVDSEAGISATRADTPDENSVESCTVIELIEKYDISRIDIFKVDIEGAELEVFSNASDEWIRKVKMLIIETHDRSREGCTKSVFNSLRNFSYNVENSGEKFVIRLSQGTSVS